MLSHVTASESDRDSAVVTCEMCSLDVAPCTISRGRRTASACGTHAPHAPTQRGHACRAHGRTTCTQEHPRWPISARARAGRHAASQLAADVAAPKTGAPAGVQRVDRCSSQIDSCTAVDRTWRHLTRGGAAMPRLSDSIPARPWTVAVQQSSRRVAAWPHRRVRGAPNLRHQKVRTPYSRSTNIKQ